MPFPPALDDSPSRAILERKKRAAGPLFFLVALTLEDQAAFLAGSAAFLADPATFAPTSSAHWLAALCVSEAIWVNSSARARSLSPNEVFNSVCRLTRSAADFGSALTLACDRVHSK